MATKLQMFVLVRVTVNAPPVRASLLRITRNWYSCPCECSLSLGAGLTEQKQLYRVDLLLVQLSVMC